MDTNEQEPANDWNYSLPVRMIKRLEWGRAGGVLSPRSERVAAAAIRKARRLVAAGEELIRHDEDGL